MHPALHCVSHKLLDWLSFHFSHLHVDGLTKLFQLSSGMQIKLFKVAAVKWLLMLCGGFLRIYW